MTVQFNTDKALSGEKRHIDYFTTQIAEDMKRYESHITRIEVHLKDVNGKKEGVNDKHCLLEARIEGKQPIAVSHQADTVPLAVNGAVNKLQNAVKKIIGRIKEH
jgi:ribosome-associated translation inhibitor RaiA